MAEDVASAECLDCACGISPNEVAECSEACWNLVQCTIDECDSDITDADCLNQECGEFTESASGISAMTMLLGPVLRQCTDVCGASDGSDAGTD